MSIYITGDTHGEFARVKNFCMKNSTTKDDILIILGDAGINYYLDMHDRILKEELQEYPITLFMIHGNHEERPCKIETYEEKEWHGGVVYQETEFPNLLFAKDGEIYDFKSRSAIVIGGAYSIDKYLRLRNGTNWFPTEQPTDEIMKHVEKQLEKVDWKVDIVLSHTTPLKYRPTDVFLPWVDQDMVDTTTEDWLDMIEERLYYKKWYAGHFHTESQEGPIRIMYTDFDTLY